MKAFVLSAALAMTTLPAVAENLAPADAKAHAGQTVTVEGEVSAVHTIPTAGVTFIDMGGSYPNVLFTAVIFAADAAKFPKPDTLAGKTVIITGQVKLYQGKPQILLKDAAQLTVK